MYSESDIEAAVAAGVLTPAQAMAFRDHVARGRAAPSVDEESFRLLTGFNDIFVSIAILLMLFAMGWIGQSIGHAIFGPMPGRGAIGTTRSFTANALFGGALIAGTTWLLAEYFTRRRRMALPSILLLAAFAGGVASGVWGLIQTIILADDPRSVSIEIGCAALASAGATLLHWRRFHVPITIAALTGALVATLLSFVFALVPAAEKAWLWLLLASGIGVFLFAMRWDMSDVARTTRRSDVAFWLHLAAAPMIAHPIFWLLGVTSGSLGGGTALAVILLYVAFGIVALAIDRRALLVSSLFYVLYALAELFKQFGAVSLNLALTALLIGSALLMLSAFWQAARRLVVEQLPAALARRLPLLDRLAPIPAT